MSNYPTAPMPALCGPCHEKWLSWLDFRIPVRNGIANGSTYDDLLRGIADNRKARYAQWRDTVNFHQSLIRKLCLADPTHRETSA